MISAINRPFKLTPKTVNSVGINPSTWLGSSDTDGRVETALKRWNTRKIVP